MSDPSRTLSATPSPMLAYAMLTTAAICWGANVIFGKLAVGEVSPMLLVLLRWLGATLLLFIFARKSIRADLETLKANKTYIFLMGAFGFTVFTSLLYMAAHHTSGLNIGIMQGAIPVFVIIGVIVVYRGSITPLQTVGVITTLVGVATVVSRGDLSQLAALQINWGDALMLLACLMYAGYTVGLRARPKASALGFFTGLTLVATLTAVPLVIAEYATGNFLWPSAKGWAVIAGVTLLPSFTAQLCFMKGVELIGPARAGVFTNLVPIFASVLVVIFLGETFGIYHAIAMALVLGGIALSEIGKEKG